MAAKTNVVPLQQASHWTIGLSLNNRGVPLGNLRNVRGVALVSRSAENSRAASCALVGGEEWALNFGASSSCRTGPQHTRATACLAYAKV
jgi:hypothetical protein